MSMTEQEFAQKVLSDESFRAQLKSDPKATLAAQGLNVPEGIEVQVVESTPSMQYLVLPPLQTGELTDEQLASAQGGSTIICTGAILVTWLAGC